MTKSQEDKLPGKMLQFVMVLTLGVVLCLPGMARGSLIYSQDFDAMGQTALVSPGAGGTVAIAPVLPGWSVTANNANRANAIVANGAMGDYAVGAYLATGDGTDFNLSSYQNGDRQANFITYTYTADRIVTGLVGSFDLESAFTRYNKNTARSGGFEIPLTYSINGGTPQAASGASGFHATNDSVTNASDVTTWLTDTRMDALGLSSRGVSFTIPSVILNPGDTITFKWLQLTTAGEKNMAQGIDNFKLGDNNSLAAAVPLPPSVLLLGSGLVGLGLLGRRRKSS